MINYFINVLSLGISPVSPTYPSLHLGQFKESSLGQIYGSWHNALVDIKNLVTYSGNLTNYISIESSLSYVSNDSYLPNKNGQYEVVCIVK